MSEEPGNQTPDTPDVSETELRERKVDELRDLAKEHEVSGTSGMRKDELVGAVAEALQDEADGSRGGSEQSGGGSDDDGDVGPGPDGGHVRTGPQTSKSLRYSQEVTSPDDEPERAGRSLVTTSHEVIKQWAEDRGGRPATVEGTEHDDHLGVLRFDFGDQDDRLTPVTWDEWFDTFDARRLNFIYQEERKDGRQSNFFRLESPEREDA